MRRDAAAAPATVDIFALVEDGRIGTEAGVVQKHPVVNRADINGPAPAHFDQAQGVFEFVGNIEAAAEIVEGARRDYAHDLVSAGKGARYRGNGAVPASHHHRIIGARRDALRNVLNIRAFTNPFEPGLAGLTL